MLKKSFDLNLISLKIFLFVFLLSKEITLLHCEFNCVSSTYHHIILIHLLYNYFVLYLHFHKLLLPFLEWDQSIAQNQLLMERNPRQLIQPEILFINPLNFQNSRSRAMNCLLAVPILHFLRDIFPPEEKICDLKPCRHWSHVEHFGFCILYIIHGDRRGQRATIVWCQYVVVVRYALFAMWMHCFRCQK